MKKNIDWLKENVQKRIDKLPRTYSGLYIEGSRDAYHLALKDIDQLDEPEVLSQEWIDEHQELQFYEANDTAYYFVRSTHLQNLLVPKREVAKLTDGEVKLVIGLDGEVVTLSWESIDKALETLGRHGTKYAVIEKPVIPAFVARVIEKNKGDGFKLIDTYDILKQRGNHYDKLTLVWLQEDWSREDLFARAWLVGFTVEEEQKYYALIKGHEYIGTEDKYWNYDVEFEGLEIGDNKVHPDVLAEYLLKATKDEWANLGINDDNADFVKVEEFEE